MMRGHMAVCILTDSESHLNMQWVMHDRRTV
jgi:hypothetical protein